MKNGKVISHDNLKVESEIRFFTNEIEFVMRNSFVKNEYKGNLKYDKMIEKLKLKEHIKCDDEFVIGFMNNSKEYLEEVEIHCFIFLLLSLDEMTNGKLLESEYVRKVGKEYEVKREIVNLIYFPQQEVKPDLGEIPCIKLGKETCEKIVSIVGKSPVKWELELPFNDFYIEIEEVIIRCVNADDERIIINYYEYDNLLSIYLYKRKEEKLLTEHLIESEWEEVDRNVLRILKVLLYYIFFYHVERKYERKDAIKEDRINEIEKEVKIEEKGKRMIFLPADKIISEGEKVEKIRVKEPEYRLPSWQRRGFINKNGTYVAPTTVHRSKELLKEGGIKKEGDRRIYQITGDRVDKSKK